MTIETKQAAIDTIMELTGTMDEASSTGKWDVVTDAEQQRRPLIKSCFADLSQLVDRPEAGLKLQQHIQTILNTDRLIMERADQARNAISNELQSISKGQRVSQAYIQNQS